jgi:hypothetical protein
MEAERPQWADLGLFLLVVAAPLLVTPFSASPFGDPKLVAVMAASVALWVAGLPLDRRLAWAAGAWVAVTGVSALVGADPSRGLTAQTGGEGGGLMLTAICAVVLLAGVGLGDDLRDRARRWFVASASFVAVFAVLIRLAPGVFGEIGSLSFVGATMGNQLFGAALVASAIPAAAASKSWGWRTLGLVALLALGTATFGERSAVILPIAGVAGFLVRAKWSWRRAVTLAVTVVAVLGVWQVVATALPSGGRGAEVTVQTQATDQQRFHLWSALVRDAVPARPVFGWGPAETQAAYLGTATVADVAVTTRLWADAHDLLLETLVSTGVIGLLALLALVLPAGLRAVRCSPDRAWAFGVATALGAYALYEPIGLVLTPLLFFFLGVAASPARVRVAAAADPKPAWGRVGKVTGTVLLTAGLVMSLVMAAGATFEGWGIRYGEAWAYRAALRIQPWRVASTERLAELLAISARSGDTGAAARDMIDAAVAAHPWDPDVRVWASYVETLLQDHAAAQRWIAAQIAQFPSDREGVTQKPSATP